MCCKSVNVIETSVFSEATVHNDNDKMHLKILILIMRGIIYQPEPAYNKAYSVKNESGNMSVCKTKCGAS